MLGFVLFCNTVYIQNQQHCCDVIIIRHRVTNSQLLSTGAGIQLESLGCG